MHDISVCLSHYRLTRTQFKYINGMYNVHMFPIGGITELFRPGFTNLSLSIIKVSIF